jgi:eukaryotic-like serine/threonine-protein kinase
MLVPIVLDVLSGLHAAHSLRDDDGNVMNLVHRDVSPQNVMVGVDGTARITDFGIARAESRIMSTRPGQLKGKLSFMSPEQIRTAEAVDRRSDVFSAGAMIWSSLTARKLFLAESDAATLSNILSMPIPPPSTIGSKPPEALDAVILQALEQNIEKRYQSAVAR